ncbi:tellurite resistance protein [Synechococcus sp. PCC 7502]|uniref:Mo-dependent nitrogenase C-terminal domain-containing protein n=1 Tax=Synechococcus sp. PCC 7502 TaxID=1173263 RepID=UPI00029FD24D|nr:Mo-dependent nitrogenase C-terminal domain-containing protein [Synechococcus sp. PCC 7502]AFY73656.1 tellurite resistance protein [Synechococcus sp. PCC 7502]
MSNFYPELTKEQRSVWLRGLLTVALADNEYSQKEQDLIQDLLKDNHIATLEPITPKEVAAVFGNSPDLAQNFLRTVVMVALVDGDYSDNEHQLIQEFSTALNQESNIMSDLRSQLEGNHGHHTHLLDPIKDWLDHLDIKDSRVARVLCKVIPAQCPFERDVFLFGRKLVHIPAMCQINPLYDQLVGLRFRSLSYLADECGEDISEFC